MNSDKILPFEGCEATFAEVREQGKTIVHCHGTFDLLHFGHIKHLEQAKKLGEILTVTITAAPFVNKGPGRPVFSDEQRAYQLAHLGIVDYVVVVPKPAAVEIIEKVRPHIYAKGIEYATPKNETDRRIDEDAEAVKRGGGEVQFVGEPLQSSSRLIGSHFDTLDPEVREYFESCPTETLSAEIDDAIRKVEKLRVLVIGDLIMDRYTYCRVQGLTAKTKVLSVRPERDVDQFGGSLAIARHAASFGCSTKLIALAGTEPWLDENLARLSDDHLEVNLVRHEDYETIVKQRYVERPGQRRDLIKYFSVNRLKDDAPPAQQAALIETLERELPTCDVVLLCDYGHGMIDAEVQALLEEKSPYLCMNCQTNSYNYGFNLITKYKKVDLFSLDERELCLAFGERKATDFNLLARLAERLTSKWAWLTLGSSGSVVHTLDHAAHACPAMVKSTVDTVGAGDAFFATVALLSRVGASVEIASLLGNLAGAMAANIVGNEEPINREAVVKNARYLLKSVS